MQCLKLEFLMTTRLYRSTELGAYLSTRFVTASHLGGGNRIYGSLLIQGIRHTALRALEFNPSGPLIK